MRKYRDLGERIAANCRLAEANETECWHNGSACWLWEGHKDAGGYGIITIRVKHGKNKGKPRGRRVHRESIRFFRGAAIRRGYVVKHLCNMRACCNPEHLRCGTQKSNMRQCVKEGRHYTPFRRSVELEHHPEIPF